MRRLQLFLLLLSIASTAAAQNARSAVSVTGSDVNNCTPASPCRSFSVAVAHTSPGGEVIAVDSGGFGAFTATTAITVSGAPGVHASITATSGQGVAVAAGAGDAVTLRNLVILNSGATDGIGITSAGSVHISNCLVRGFGADAGINVADTETEIDRTTLQNNGYGVSAAGSVVFNVRITNSQIDDNIAVGVNVTNRLRMLIADTALTGNPIGVRIISTGFTSDIMLDHAQVVGNNIGIFLQAPDANQNATVRLYGSMILYNTAAGIEANVGLALTYGNNAINMNNPDLLNVALTPVAQQ